MRNTELSRNTENIDIINITEFIILRETCK